MPLMEFAEFDRRPVLVAIAGPNGAGRRHSSARTWPLPGCDS